MLTKDLHTHRESPQTNTANDNRSSIRVPSSYSQRLTLLFKFCLFAWIFSIVLCAIVRLLCKTSLRWVQSYWDTFRRINFLAKVNIYRKAWRRFLTVSTKCQMNIKYDKDESIGKSILNFSASLRCYVLAILRQEARGSFGRAELFQQSTRNFQRTENIKLQRYLRVSNVQCA